MSLITQSRRDALKAALLRLLRRAERTYDGAFEAFADEFIQILYRVSFGSGPPTPQNDGTVNEFGDLYCDETNAILYIYSPNAAFDNFTGLPIGAGWQTVAAAGGQSTSASVGIEDEGVLQGPATTLDFVGAGVTAVVGGGTATITIPGGGTPGDEERVISDDGKDWTAGYREITPAANAFPTAVTWYVDVTKVTKLFEKLITRDVDQKPTTIVWKFYVAGIAIRTVTDTISYSGIYETSRTRVSA